jgi:hypothetical protein
MDPARGEAARDGGSAGAQCGAGVAVRQARAPDDVLGQVLVRGGLAAADRGVGLADI